MTILFGNLVNEFVKFGTVTIRIDSGDPTAAAELPEVARAFRHQAAQLATYLVVIGVSIHTKSVLSLLIILI
jgi:ATP-binding cassette subfamily B (MDR/TAP) protein 1